MSLVNTLRKLTLTALAVCCFSIHAQAQSQVPGADDPASAPAPKQQAKKMNPLLGPPVNIGMGGGGILPKGILLTAINLSIREKHSSVGPGNQDAPHVDQQIYLAKIRYGLTDRIEINTVIPYSFTDRHQADGSKFHMDGFGDVAVGASYQLLGEKFGDPLSVAASVALLLPTGEYGYRSAPGNGSWGNMVKLGAKKDINATHRFETEIAYTTLYTNGNRNIRKGDAFAWNSQYRYMTSHNFDLGLESMVEKNFGSRKEGQYQPDSSVDWYFGPSTNIAIPSLNMWFGAGVFAGLAHDYETRKQVEDFRIEFKLGKLWF